MRIIHLGKIRCCFCGGCSWFLIVVMLKLIFFSGVVEYIYIYAHINRNNKANDPRGIFLGFEMLGVLGFGSLQGFAKLRMDLHALGP